MIIEKIINNNIVCAANGDKLEKILMGKGIGFGKKIGDLVDESKIEKIFVLSSQEQMHKFLELLAEIPLKYMYLADDIINYAKLTIGTKLSDYLYISLVDHVYAAIKRFKKGMKIFNALYYEIKRFYPDEFSVGEFALNLIKNEIGVELPLDEAGFIALHIVNAYTDNRSIQQVMAITELVQNITNIVKYEFKVDFDESSLNFYRFITHLKFFAKRVIDNQIYLDEADDDFFIMVKKKYKNSYNCVLKIKYFLKKAYQHELTNEEAIYLTIHIERVIYRK